MKLRPKGIFCLEGDWSGDLRRPSSVEPILAVIDQQLTPKRHHIHRDIGTVGELKYYLSKWVQKQYVAYPILYLGFHGYPGLINIGDGRKSESDVSLDALADHLQGSCERKLIHLTSCSTLRWHGAKINTFLKKTGALAISGYQTEVDWIASAAFELLVLTEFQFGPLTPKGAENMKIRIQKAAGGLAQQLQFRMDIRDENWSSAKALTAGA